MNPEINFNSSFPENKVASAAQLQQFIWPQITDADYKASMDNFRLYKAQYNRKLTSLNSATRRYNQAVADYSVNHPPDANKMVLLKLFKSKYYHLKNTDKANYTLAVESFNENHGMYFKKVKFQTLKTTSEIIFSNFIHVYAVQLKKYVGIWKATNKTTPTPLPKCDINPHRIVRLQRNGEVTVDLCKRTIRAYRSRFEEAGILYDKQFRGTEIPVNYLFNADILSISDAFLTSKSPTENQHVNSSKRKELQHGHNDISTRTIKKQLEKKGIVNSDERNTSLLNNLFFYKTTNLQGGKDKKNHGAEKSKPGAKILKEMADLSKVLDQLDKEEAGATPKTKIPAAETQYFDEASTAKRENRFALAAELATGAHDFYVPIHHKNLKQLIENPNISDAQFLEIGKICFIKTAAKLYQGNHPIAKSWGAGIKHIDKIIDAKALNFSGNAKTKNEVYTVLMGFRFRLNYAIRKFKKMKWQGVLYPGVYFNPLRSLPSDVCFDYTRKVWTKALKTKQKTAQKKRKEEIEARKRGAQLVAKRKAARYAKNNPQQPTTPQEKLDNAIYKYLRKEYDLQKLTHYVIHNLPEEWQVKLSPRLQELTLRRLTNK